MIVVEMGAKDGHECEKQCRRHARISQNGNLLYFDNCGMDIDFSHWGPGFDAYMAEFDGRDSPRDASNSYDDSS